MDVKKFIDFDKISVSGIRNVTKVDMDYAKKTRLSFKMIAQAKEVNNGIGIDVAATLVNKKELVANVMDAYNVIEIDNDYVENVIFYGKGADVMLQHLPLVVILLKQLKKSTGTMIIKIVKTFIQSLNQNIIFVVTDLSM